MVSFLIYCNAKFDLKNNFFSENLTSTTRTEGSSHPKILVVDNYETQTQNYAIGLSVDMLTCNHRRYRGEDESDDNIEYWLNDALEKINLTSDSSENECKCCIFSNNHLGTYLKFFKVRGCLLY